VPLPGAGRGPFPAALVTFALFGIAAFPFGAQVCRGGEQFPAVRGVVVVGASVVCASRYRRSSWLRRWQSRR
jgi:hypothetical protein